MTKRITIKIMIFLVFVCICLSLFFLRISNTFLRANVSEDAILLEYPEMAFTEKDAEWLETVLSHEKTQKVLSSPANSETEFRLLDTDLEPFYQFPKNNCLISASGTTDGSKVVTASFEPIVKNEKILDFSFSVLSGTGRESSFIKTLSVYKFHSETAIAYNNIMARYWNFGDFF